MLTTNQIACFETGGRRAARAVKANDDSQWVAERQWLRQQTIAYSPADKREAKRAWDLAYVNERGMVPRLGYGER